LSGSDQHQPRVFLEPNLVFDANGNLYGTTYGGGASGNGVVWEITP
jgi:uncharacterized repeat protein (TIGR03803 family)